MLSLSAAQLSEWGGGAMPEVSLADASGISFHSGRVRPGDAFFALPGARGHGMDFADQALKAGAAFIVSDRPHPRGVLVEDPAWLILESGRRARAQLAGPVIGVTGSAGKTSTKAMIAAALNAEVSPGNFNTPLALARVLVDAWLGGRSSTGDALVLELGIDHPGEMAELLALTRPTHGVLTLIAASHLEALRDVKTVASEKSRLLEFSEAAFACIQTRDYLSQPIKEKTIFYGFSEDTGAELSGKVVYVATTTIHVEVFGKRLTVPYPGLAMARNAIIAMGIAKALAIDLDEAAEHLAAVRLEPGRLERLERGKLTIIDDSYNSNPASLHQALEVLRASPGPHSAILGAMLELGAESEALHLEMGEATRGLEQVIVVGPEARAMARANPQARYFETVEQAIEAAEQLPREGTVLVKASRGMRFERFIEPLEQAARQ